MKKFTFFYTFLAIIIFPLLLSAQGIGINNTGSPANPKALLDIDAATMNPKAGLLLPRMTTTERNAITPPIPESLLIFNTTTKCYEGYVNNAWYALSCAPCIPPPIPVALAASGIGCTLFTSNWNVSAGATSYFIDVATNTGFTSFVAGYNNLNVGNVTSFPIAGLSQGVTYYFRVRAATTCSSDNSNTIIIVTNTNCCTSFTDSRDGRTYNAVQIGTQCWMAENLNYGTYVPVSLGGQSPVGTQKYCQNLSGVNDPTCPMGGLYEWNEMMNGSSGCNGTGASQPACTNPVQGICPAGWHIPSHYEWTLLEKNSGSNPNAFPYDITTSGNWLGTDEGGNLKVTPICGTLPCWNAANIGATNSTGFSALPGGNSYSGGLFNVAYAGLFWSCTETGTNVWNRNLDYSHADIVRALHLKGNGFSVRCVRD